MAYGCGGILGLGIKPFDDPGNAGKMIETYKLDDVLDQRHDTKWARSDWLVIAI
jgi:hypothetical protein